MRLFLGDGACCHITDVKVARLQVTVTVCLTVLIIDTATLESLEVRCAESLSVNSLLCPPQLRVLRAVGCFLQRVAFADAELKELNVANNQLEYVAIPPSVE